MITRSNCVVLLVISSIYLHASAQESMFSIKPGNIIARIGFPARLDCQINTAGFVRWLVGATNKILPAPGCNCVVLSHNSSFSSLYFNQTTHATGGDYTCSIVGGPIGKINGSIIIAIDPEITPNDFSITRNENDTFAINVSVTGVPRPIVTWLKDGINFTSERTGVIATRSGLQVTNASHRASGRYRILASNKANTAINFYNIFVNFLPIVTMTRDPDISEVPVGSNVTVTCSIMSYPGSSVHWEQQTDNEYTTLSAFNERNDSSNMFMVVTNSTIVFVGEDINGANKYCCAATNIIGVAKKCCNFSERGVPLMPTKLRLTSTTSSVNVSWESLTTDLDIMYELSWHKDGVLVNSTMLPSNMMSYRIEGLEADTEYVLMINAQTDKSSATTSITVSTLVAAPGPVLNFTVDVLKSWNTFQLTWTAPKESEISHYTIYVRTINNLTSLMVPSINTSYFYDYQENIMYEFAIQAVNVRGSGPVSNYITVFHCSTDVLLGVSYVPYGYSVNILWNVTKISNIKQAYLVVTDNFDGKYIFPFVFDKKTSLCINNLVPNANYFVNIIITFDCVNMTKTVTESVDFITLPADGSSLMQGCNGYEIPQQNNASVVSSNSHSATSAIIGGTMGAVILLLLIIVVLCAVVLCVNRTRNASPTDHYSPSYDDTLNYGLYSTIKPIELDVITTNRSYNIPTKPHSKSNEDEYTYVQPDHCIRPSDLEDDVKMDANPSYGVSTVEDRVTGFKTTAADTDTRPHHSPQQDDYDDVIAITNNDGIEENNAQIHTIVNQKYNTNLYLTTYHQYSGKPAGKGENGTDDQSQNDGPKQQSDGVWYTDV